MRAALISAVIALLAAPALAAPKQACTKGDGTWIVKACYANPLVSGLYNHTILGDTPEWSSIEITLGEEGKKAVQAKDDAVLRIQMPEGLIFEDLAPRLIDVTGDGKPEIMAVQTDFTKGARLLVAGLGERFFAATPYIGTPKRWLAPVGAADLDGDGSVEVVYVDRPHLDRVLTITRYVPATTDQPSKLAPVAQLKGLSNHRIGQDQIEGGIATCGDLPAIYTADADWAQIMQTRWTGAGFETKAVGPYAGPASFAPYLDCTAN